MLEDSGRHLKYVVPVQNNILYYRAGTRYLAAWAARLASPCDTLNLRCGIICMCIVSCTACSI